MRKTSILFLAGLSLCAASLPAAARALGTVNVSAEHYTHVRWTRFDDPVARLSFVPDNDAVDCDHIVITYRDGASYNMFSGVLLKNQEETIFPDRGSRLESVSFACKAKSRDGARIAITAVSAKDGQGDDPVHYPDANLNHPAQVQITESADAAAP